MIPKKASIPTIPLQAEAPAEIQANKVITKKIFASPVHVGFFPGILPYGIVYLLFFGLKSRTVQHGLTAGKCADSTVTQR